DRGGADDRRHRVALPARQHGPRPQRIASRPGRAPRVNPAGLFFLRQSWAMLFRYISREILLTSLFVLVALLALFGFFDLIHELDDLGKGTYRLPAMLAYVSLSLASHAYVLLPAAGLIGTLFALARMSEHSEITVMRASGLSLVQLAFYVAG